LERAIVSEYGPIKLRAGSVVDGVELGLPLTAAVVVSRECGVGDRNRTGMASLEGCSHCAVRGLDRWSGLVLQPHLVMFEVLSLVVACSGVGLVASSPVGPVVGVCSGV
jgi:hypothetical protein